MKIIINEYHLSLLRRVGMIEDMIYPMMDETYDYLQSANVTLPMSQRDYRVFESTVVMVLANKLANQTSLDGDEKVMLRNQLQRYITNEYGSQIKDYYLNKIEDYKK